MTDKQAKATTREQALRVARMLGCQGAHEQGDGWMPCGSPEEYVAIKKGEEEYLKVRASRKKKPQPTIVQRTKRLETKSDAYYENRADALAVSRARGCNGVRTVILAGKKYYAVCEPKKPKNGWENLTEKPITGIATLPGGGIVTGSFSGKSLGRTIGDIGDFFDRAEFDGDGDGFSTGPDGKDNVPVVPKVVKHAGSQYLKSINEQRALLEKEFGDLSNPKNVEKAFEKTFKNLETFGILSAPDKPLSALEIGHVVALLHLGKDKRVADTINYIGDLRAMASDRDWKGTNAANALGFALVDGKPKMQHSILFNKSVSGYAGGTDGWGDQIASQMKKQGASKEDIDTFWGNYVANHEWVHAEHHVSAMEYLGLDINGEAYDLLKKLAQDDGVDEKTFDAGFKKEIERLKLLSPDMDEGEISESLISTLIMRRAEVYKKRMTSAKEDDLLASELRQLGGGYPATVSLYATSNFSELVAEKGSASRMGHPAGSSNNPAWRKLQGFVRGGVAEEMATQGMTRQQRRQLERENQKKKQLTKDNYFDNIKLVKKPKTDAFGNIFIISRCTGFPHSHGKSEEKSLEGKGFVNFVSRSTDPDVFSNPESARIRARNLGCIGIRRYTAGDGKTVWLPCTNVSDFNRLSGIRGDNSPINSPRRQGSNNRKKVLGRPIGGVSDFDGDGDGLVSNAAGEDIIPALPKPNLNRTGPEGVEMQLGKPLPQFAKYVDGDFSNVVAVEPEKRKRIAEHYDKQPIVDEKAKKAYDELASEIDKQFEILKKTGLNIEFVDYDPYEGFDSMRNDVVQNNRLKIMKTSVTGSHPYWDDDANDKFRAVHDAFGHLATGRGFDRHGEEAAYQAHKSMMPQSVHGVLAMETRGQNAYVIDRGDFPPQKVGILPEELAKRLRDSIKEQRASFVTADDDNLFKLGGSHHISGGRYFPSKKKTKAFVGEGIISFKGVPKAKKKPPTLTSDDINNLAVRVRQHNAKSKTESKTNLRDLKIVYIRGLLDDGREEADKRVSKFLSLLNSEKPKDVKYSEDNDLLPLEHPWRNRKTSKKFAGFTDGEYGVKYSSGCCPDVVKRYRAK